MDAEIKKDVIDILIKEASYKEPLESKLLYEDNGCSTYQVTYALGEKFYALQYHTSYINGYGDDSSDYRFVGEVVPKQITTYELIK